MPDLLFRSVQQCRAPASGCAGRRAYSGSPLGPGPESKAPAAVGSVSPLLLRQHRRESNGFDRVEYLLAVQVVLARRIDQERDATVRIRSEWNTAKSFQPIIQERRQISRRGCDVSTQLLFKCVELRVKLVHRDADRVLVGKREASRFCPELPRKQTPVRRDFPAARKPSQFVPCTPLSVPRNQTNILRKRTP